MIERRVRGTGADGGRPRWTARGRSPGRDGRRRGRIRTGAPLGLLVVACLLGTAACSGDDASPSPSPSEPTVAPTAFGAYGTTTDDTFADTEKLAPEQARLVGPHFAVQFDRVSFTGRLSHAQAMNFGYFRDMNHDMDDMDDMSSMDHARSMKGPSLKAAPGHRFMILHTVPALPKLAPALPEYKNNIAPEDKVKGEFRVGGTTVRLPGIVRDLASDHVILVSVPKDGDPVLAITDAGRTQTLNLRTGHRETPGIPAYYPLRAADQVGVSANGAFGDDRSAALTVHSDRPALQPYAEGRGWAGKGKAWLYLGGDIETQIGTAAGSERLDAVLDAARSFTLTLPGGATVRAAGTASTKAPLPLGTAGQADDRSGVARGAFSVAFAVPDDFRTGTVRFAPHGTYRFKGKPTTFTTDTPARPIHLSVR